MKRIEAYEIKHDNGDHYVILRDYACGRRNRYTILLWRVGKMARVVGRELPLGYSKKLIAARANRPGKKWLP